MKSGCDGMIDCKKIAQEIKEQCKEELKSLHPNLYLKIIQVEGDLASKAYTKGKIKDCEEIGLGCKHILLPNNCSVADVRDEISKGNVDNLCVGIILQLPLPQHLKQHEEHLVNCINPAKDVDGFIEESSFDPCTPAGIIHIAKEQLGSLDGKVVMVIGRGKLVGAPLVKLLNKENATIIHCNSHTDKQFINTMGQFVDVIVTATGCINTLHEAIHNSIFLSEPVIIDAGINKDKDGKLCGDCSKGIYQYLDTITPVPGGVGLITRAMLMKNCIEAAKRKEVYRIE